MYKYVIGIDGMKCGMCESHVQDVIRKSIKVKKVKASHLKNNVIVISDLDLTIDAFKEVFKPTGYKITSFLVDTAKKKLFGWR